MSAATSGPTVAARMDRLPITRTHLLATVAVGLGLFFDLYEIFVTGVLAAVLTNSFYVDKADLPAVLSSTFVGMFVGALVLGRLADKVGRRGAFLTNLALYSVFSFIGAFSVGPIMLMTTRFFAGLGIGAELPLADTYLGELLPQRHRRRYTAWSYTVSSSPCRPWVSRPWSGAGGTVGLRGVEVAARPWLARLDRGVLPAPWPTRVATLAGGGRSA